MTSWTPLIFWDWGWEYCVVREQGRRRCYRPESKPLELLDCHRDHSGLARSRFAMATA